MHVLVTGHKGYIGSLAVEMLKQHGFQVTGYDVDYFRECVFEKAVEPDREIIKDIREIEAYELDGIDAIFHFAALSNDPSGELDPDLTESINYHASVHLAMLAKQAGVERYLYSSSCSLYGKAEGANPKTEIDAVNPLTAYAKSKVSTELAVAQLANEHFSPVFMRNATAYGVSPKLRLDLVLNNLVAVALTSGQIRIMSDGTPWRPLIHARDIVQAFIAVLRTARHTIHNQVFNVGINGENYQVREIAEIVREVVGVHDVVFTGEHGSDSRSYRVSFDKIQQCIPDFQPEWTITRGAEELYRKLKQKHFTPEDIISGKFIRLKQLRYLLDTGLVNAHLERKK